MIERVDAHRILAEQVLIDNGIDPEKRRRKNYHMYRATRHLREYRTLVSIAAFSLLATPVMALWTILYSPIALYWVCRWLWLKLSRNA